MMDREQYLLNKIAEEASEVAKRALKAQQFGLDEIQKGQPLNNMERLIDESQDLIISLELLMEAYDRCLTLGPPYHKKQARLASMRKYLKLAQDRGQVGYDVKI